MSREKISSIITSSYNQAPSLAYNNVRIKLKFIGALLKQDKITYNHEPIVNIYMVYRLSPSITNDITLENCLFGAVKLTKNLKITTYSGYGIAFDSKGSFYILQNVIIFGTDLGSSVHANNRANNILVLRKDFMQRINGTIIYAEKNLFVNGKEIINLEAKDSETVPYPLCLGNISKDFSLLNTTNSGLYGYVYGFSVDYKAVANDKIHDIHRYLMEKKNIK